MLLRRVTKHVREQNKLIFFVIFILSILTSCATTQHDQTNIKKSKTNLDQSYPPSLVELNFDSYGKRLNGILYQANGQGPHPTVVLLHGYPGNEKNLDLAQEVRRKGYNVLFFHYRGAWGSGGDFSFTHVVEDVNSATAFLRNQADKYRVDANRIYLVGHSMGGFAALQGAARDSEIKCVAGLASADVGTLAKIVESDPAAAKSFASGADNLSMLANWSGNKVLAELKSNKNNFSLISIAPKLNGKAVLLVAADQDKVIVPEVFHKPMVTAYQQQPNIKLTHKIISGDHSFSWSRLELINAVSIWLDNCE